MTTIHKNTPRLSHLEHQSQNEEKHAPKGCEKSGQDAEAVTPRHIIHPGARHPVTVVAHLRKYQGNQEHQESCKKISNQSGTPRRYQSNQERQESCKKIYFCMYCWLISYSPVNHPGSPQGFSQVQISHTSWIPCTLHTHKTYNYIIRKVVLSVSLVKNGK